MVVVAARGSGTMADMLPAAQQFLAHGFTVLTFEYRGFGPSASSAAVDSLRYILLNSQWVGDMLGALRYARARGGAHVFAWGQDLGSAVALAAANRERASCDAVAVEGLFRTTQEALLANGTSVLHDVEIRHRRLVEGRDEPFSAASRLRCPLFVVMAGKDEVTPPAATRTVVRRVPGRVEVWELPAAGHADAEATPGYFDRLAKWFRQWTAYPPGARGAGGAEGAGPARRRDEGAGPRGPAPRCVTDPEHRAPIRSEVVAEAEAQHGGEGLVVALEVVPDRRRRRGVAVAAVQEQPQPVAVQRSSSSPARTPSRGRGSRRRGRRPAAAG